MGLADDDEAGIIWPVARHNTRFRRYVFELPVTEIAKQLYAVVQCHSQVVQVVAVVIALNAENLEHVGVMAK